MFDSTKRMSRSTIQSICGSIWDADIPVLIEALKAQQVERNLIDRQKAEEEQADRDDEITYFYSDEVTRRE